MEAWLRAQTASFSLAIAAHNDREDADAINGIPARMRSQGTSETIRTAKTPDSDITRNRQMI
jgi:hypothetical protein